MKNKFAFIYLLLVLFITSCGQNKTQERGQMPPFLLNYFFMANPMSFR